MDNFSINGPLPSLPSTSPVKEVQSRHSGSGDHQQSRNRRGLYNPEPVAEEDDLPHEDDSPHAVDEQA
ncbi:MAG TPA: hypothetical protein VMI10_24385 [Terriglobales bacterium]|nr:hypothetical protein [Terriglobales bacterium]